ncbi:hypothetical protein BCR35DRAFT_300805 [Leucosporidium creatinivorum]|uniref:Uncharacterized protein n=1 Tax=Leucosporidium creatinivorum TaxID=106004 RepID=A0A1Y2G2C0_9BASI|nr:hypothetical protein BCR35DRAFT_300805 [Leucosporidium creatinivorum]
MARSVAETLDYVQSTPSLSHLSLNTRKQIKDSDSVVAALLARTNNSTTLTSLSYYCDEGVEAEDVASLEVAFPKAIVTVARVRQRFDSAQVNADSVGRPAAVERLVELASETLDFARERLGRVTQLDDVEGAEEMVKLLAGVRGRMHVEDD